ncbi:diguanylate cyclase [Comamonas testosteroni]|uniref:diguanylate cyclase n=1 Tax=Comamonas testosteroni TaxID=285 RepID=A0A373FAA7_COMTE|nr:GGDEF domain-containing protein [Comamonas testosteroni]RGE41111.1 diguanylate cyclase [Comamonas testosteroni]
MTEPTSQQNNVAQPAAARKQVWVHLVPWLVMLFFGLLVAGAAISGLLWNPQSLGAWLVGWAVASAAWLVLSKVWKQSWPLVGYGVVTCFAALALFWARPGFASLALFLWLSAGAMFLWGCADQPKIQALGVGLALVNAAAAVLMAAVLAWPQSQAPAELIQAAAAVMALACHAGLAALALWHQQQQARQSIFRLEQRCESLAQEVHSQRQFQKAGAQNDVLTGVESLPRIMDFINQLRERNARKVETFCVALVEIDPWEAREPQAVGGKGPSLQQKVQIMLSGLLGSQIRTVDRLGRHKGESFLLVLPDTNSTQAIWVLHRIRESMRFGQWGEIKALVQGPSNLPTLTIAVAEYLPRETAEQLLARASMALQHGHDTGHDKIVIAEDLNF